MRTTTKVSAAQMWRNSPSYAIISNRRGQMALFIALLFQILFVFFAMIVNVGLLVHDKINLQNSVDMGAIYAAQKQAEVLSMIAHTNYQMRQSWKLLAWRMHVLGDMGRQTHPLTSNKQFGPEPDAPDTASAKPIICLAHESWKETVVGNGGQPENICKKGSLLRIPKIPQTKIIAPFLGFPTAVQGFSEKMREVFKQRCKDAGPLNWLFAGHIYYHFKLEQSYRRQLVVDLIENMLNKGGMNFRDMNGESIREGVIRTITKNMTRSNRENFDPDRDVEIFNSLEGKAANEIFPPIPVKVLVPYMDFTGADAASCNAQLRFFNAIPNPNAPNPNGLNHLPVNFSDDLDPQKVLQSAASDPFTVNDKDHPVVGVEKNPWLLAYVGVKVKVRARQPFAPLGRPVEVVAKAFAQPFGGRIGPWFQKKWPRGAPTSEGEKVDALLPKRASGIGMGPTDDDIPNYSKYPGDKLGLRSRMALGAMKKYIFTPVAKIFSFREQYEHLRLEIVGRRDRDALAWDVTKQVAPWNRNLEVAAVAPDLFDLAYYSIEPFYHHAYISQTKIQGAVDNLQIWGDLGSRNVRGLETFAVADQIKQTVSDPAGGVYPPWVNYVARDWKHTLTAWAQPEAVEYTFPTEKFGNCVAGDRKATDPTLAIPGGCTSGGRSNFSVKIISKDYLVQSLRLGGDETGPILNPPPDGF